LGEIREYITQATAIGPLGLEYMDRDEKRTEVRADRLSPPKGRKLALTFALSADHYIDRLEHIFPSLHKDSGTGHRARLDGPFRRAVKATGLDPAIVTRM
jgi:hypothetical protein